jgi:hypothetical protein
VADYSKIPPALKRLRRWCNWQEGTKAPTPAVGHTPLLTFEEAVSISEFIGFHFNDTRYTGIDIDLMTERAHLVLAAARLCGAYIERSPSGRGWHILGEGQLPRGIGKGRVDEGIEAYSDGRYFTVTGQGSGDPDVSIQHILDELIALLPTPKDTESVGEQWDEDTHLPLLAHADCESYENWVGVGMALKDAGAEFEVWDAWAQNSSKWPGSEAASSKWDSFRGAGRTLGTLYMLAREGGWAEEYDVFDVIEPPAPPENRWLAVEVFGSSLTHEPPPRTWAWDQWIPHGVVTGLAGEPGVAKSTMALQLCVHHALGVPYMDADVGKGPALFITVEDDAHELHRRYHRICDGLFVFPGEVQGLSLIAATNMVTELATVAKDGGNVRETALMRMLDELVVTRGFGLVVLDLVGDFWSGSENSRSEVSGYVRAILGRFCQRHGCAALVISHLNKLGGVSGSTAWLGSYRSAISMVRAAGDVILVQRIKANYAPPQEHPVKVRWAEGYVSVLPRSTLDAEAREQLEVRLAAMPQGQWLGVNALRECWPDLTQGQAKATASQLVSMTWVAQQAHGGRDRWRV